MKTIDRIEQLIAQLDISVRAFEVAIDVSNSTISKAIKAKASVGSDILEKIFAAYPKVDPVWLLTGQKAALTPSGNQENAADDRSKKPLPGSVTKVKTSPNASPTTSPTRKKEYNYEASGGMILNEKRAIYGAHTPKIITVNESGIDNILYVPVTAQAGYLVGHGDPEFIESLPSFRMPGFTNKSYRMFEVKGISMAPTLSDGDRVIAEWVPSFADIRENRIHVVVHAGGVVIKRVLNRIDERQKLYLKSDTVTHRHDYPIIELNPADIQEMWYVRMSLSGDLREPSELYERMSNLEIEQHETQEKLQQIMKKLALLPK
jgi:phage repressor protein C with HTH and peptisase S24 domain